ncbi:MAG: hypothetical protein ABGF52_09515 [Candidatus Asgardarchaeum sp.]
MRAEAIKAYKIPIKPLMDLIDAYFKIKSIVLEEILSHVKYSKSDKA